MKIRKIILIITLFFLISSSYSQEKNFILNTKEEKDIVFSFTGYIGNVILSGIDGVTANDRIVKSLIINVGKQTTGDNISQVLFNYPDFGVGFRYTSFNYDVLESSYSLYGYFNSKYYQNKFLEVMCGLDFGLSYYTNPYHYINNPDNIFIGSNLNCYINLSSGIKFKIDDFVDITPKIIFYHSSNGTIKRPNRGTNGFSGGIEFNYHLNGRKPYKSLDTTYFFTPKNSIYFTEAVGMRSAPNKKRYFANTLQIGYKRMFNPIFGYGGGFDFMYSGAVIPEYNNPFKKVSGRSIATYGSFNIVYNRLDLHLAIGYYLYKPHHNLYTPIYERVGLKYMLGHNLNHSVGIMMKVHFGAIDYIEWAYSFNFINWNDKKPKPINK
ncbi:MAG: acyloxyacyl hydrolase [Bacteroidales bacterium]|jgi:hypothetical protein